MLRPSCARCVLGLVGGPLAPDVYWGWWAHLAQVGAVEAFLPVGTLEDLHVHLACDVAQLRLRRHQHAHLALGMQDAGSTPLLQVTLPARRDPVRHARHVALHEMSSYTARAHVRAHTTDSNHACS